MKKLRLSFLMLSLLLIAVGASAQKSDCQTPTGVAVEPSPTSALVSWTGYSDSYNVRYKDVSFFEDFENDLDGWTIYTLGQAPSSDGWYLLDPSQSLSCTAHGGNQVASAWSWAGTAFNADNWLVSPQLDLGGTLRFYDYTNATYPDSYEVLLSTTGNEMADFTVVLRDMAVATGGEWGEVSIDLSQYAGKKGYIAIHHVSNDMNYLLIDDFCINDDGSEWSTITTTEESIEITGLKPESSFMCQVQGVCAASESEWSDPIFFKTLESCPMPFDVKVTPAVTTASVTWKGYSENYNVRYRIPATKEILFFEGFEDGIPETWTNVDNDGDKDFWSAINNMGEDGDYGFGGGFVTSASYINNVGALTPDNWLISPQLDLDGTLSVWLRGQDASYAAEHFAVYLSTASTSIRDFSIELIPETVTTGVLTEYTADLSQYKGQKGYIAIRHFNCTDMYRLNLDNFALLGDEVGGSEWTTITTDETNVDLTGLEKVTTYELQVQGVCDNVPTEWTNIITFTTLDDTVDLVMLDDDYDQPEGATNTDVLIENKGKNANVVFKDRVFYKDGEWNSLCLPFSLTAEQIANSPLADATIYGLYAAGVDGKHVDFYFTPTDEISSTWLYIFKWEEPGDNIVSPEFNYVKIEADEGPLLPSPDYHAFFLGSYSTFIADPAEDEYYTYYLGAGNKLRYSPNKVKIYPFRLYCVFFDNSEVDPDEVDYSFIFDNEHVDGIVELDSALKNLEAKGIYNLQGVKVNDAKQKGIYIMNGRKVVVK